MNILYIGDIMGRPGVDVVSKVLPELSREHELDLVIAQAENVTDGKGMCLEDMAELKSYGVDFFSGGNHTPSQVELHQALEDDEQPVIGPANMPASPGKGWKYVTTPNGLVLVVSLMGAKVGTPITASNPLSTIDRILDENRTIERLATIVNFHGDFSSEKRVIGYYLDGKVSAVIGDHWHVPTADAMILPKGTAHITDVGMCGALHSSLGIKTEIIVERWRNGKVNKNEMELFGPKQFNALLVTIDNGLASHVTHIQRILPV